MKPKYSSGYLTPQANRKKPKSRCSESAQESTTIANVNDSFFEKLLSCPIKRQLILHLISSDHDKLKEYMQKQSEEQKKRECNESPLSKIQKKYKCESPTALLRRRALEQQARQSPISSHESVHSRSNSRHSNTSSCPSPLPFNKLLDGITAYVEIRSKDQDRSSGVKALMRSMGATVRDQFTKDVTHVVFKDGSFTTYQKAKLMKIHLVSILWVEAVRSSGTRVPEMKFPALGTEAYDHNVSSICSQMQKDYEDILRDEVRRSLATGTPLPSTKSLIDRRRTMTPMHSTLKQFSQEFPSSQDKEVENIIKTGRKTRDIFKSTPFSIRLTPELTSDDDSDLGPLINGKVVTRKKDLEMPDLSEDQVVINSIENLSNMELTPTDISRSSVNNRFTNNACNSNMDLTALNASLTTAEITKENDNPNVLDNSIYNKKTPKLRSKKDSQEVHAPKRSEDNTFSVPDNNLYKRRTRQLKISPSDCSSSKKAPSGNLDDTSSDDVAVKSTDLKILSIHLHTSTEKQNLPEKSSSTNMSSLRISSDSNKEKEHSGENLNKILEKSTSTNMSALVISSDSSTNQTNRSSGKGNVTSSDENLIPKQSKKVPFAKILQDNGFNSSTSNDSFSPLKANVEKALQVLNETSLSDENVTKRRGRYSIQKTYNTRRKTILPVDNMTDSGGLSPPKKARNELLNDSSTKNQESPQPKDENKKTLGGRRKTISTNGEHTTLNGNKVSNKRRTLLPSIKNTVTRDSDSSSSKSSSKELTLSKKIKDDKSTQPKSNDDGDTKPFNDNKKTLRGKKNMINKVSKAKPKQCDKPTEINKTPTNDSCPDVSNSGGSSQKNKGLRKLYNPDDTVKDIDVCDEKEREDKRTKVKKRSCDNGIIVNSNNNIVSVTPNVLLTAKAKEFMDKNKINIQTILNKELEQSEEEKPRKRKEKKKQKEDKRASVNSELDEQQELAKEFINKKGDTKLNRNNKKTVKDESGKIKRRQSVRLSQHPRKKLNFNSSTSSDDEKIVPVTTVNRRSTLDFQPLSQTSIKKKLKIDKAKQPSVVCTRLHKSDVQVFHQIVKKLGGFTIEEEVSSKTTHLVAGEPKRTINMLRAMVLGCWILKQEWLYKSLEEGRWLPEEDYEETDFSPAVQQCRLQRQAFGSSFSMDIFQDCGPIYIARGSIPRCSDLRELVSLCKGKIVTIPRTAEIVVGEFVRREDVKCVKETWILDSITSNKRMPYKKYAINAGSDSPFV